MTAIAAVLAAARRLAASPPAGRRVTHRLLEPLLTETEIGLEPPGYLDRMHGMGPHRLHLLPQGRTGYAADVEGAWTAWCFEAGYPVHPTRLTALRQANLA